MAMDRQDQGSAPGPIRAVVCVPTFRRPAWLERTLTSILTQETDFGFALVVVDNDAAKAEGAAVAQRLLSGSALPHRVLTEADQGNVHAINRAFGVAIAAFPEAEFFLMIDDDEMAMPGWLAAIVATAERENADLVGGPVVREFDVPVPDTIAHHPLFGFIPGETRQIDQIHGSGNCLIRRRVFAAMPSPPFDARFNFLGGGDMEFFTRCKKAGYVTWWCAEAGVKEFVAAERVSPRFLARRSIRTGSINYVIDRMDMPLPLALGKNVISLGLGAVRSLGMLVRTRSVIGASHPFLMSIGRITASLGMVPQPYRAKR